jgi:hypothetical protein
VWLADDDAGVAVATVEFDEWLIIFVIFYRFYNILDSNFYI